MRNNKQLVRVQPLPDRLGLWRLGALRYLSVILVQISNFSELVSWPSYDEYKQTSSLFDP